MLLLEALNLKAASFRAVRDLALLCAHLGIYLGGLALILGPARAAVFVALHQGLVGLHLGLVFAPGHKGMAMPAPGAGQDFLRKQVLTTRNVRGGRVIDWFFGGLNYQIEHHLFPSMPRPCLRHAHALVRAHCAKLGLPYHDETMRASLPSRPATCMPPAMPPRPKATPETAPGRKRGGPPRCSLALLAGTST